VKLDAIHQRVVVDGPGVGGTMAKRLSISLAGTAYVGARDARKRNQFNRVDFDLRTFDRVAVADLYLGTLPKPERHRDIAAGDSLPEFLTELHDFFLRTGGQHAE
jgi:hypothetical protein